MPSYLTSDPSLTPDYNVPGEINPGITPGVWQTLRGPFQLPSSDYNQAMAEFDAREANPRSGIPDDQLKELTLERALEEQLSPFNVGLAMGAQAVAPYSTGRNYQYMGLGGAGFGQMHAPEKYFKSGNDLVKVDSTGKASLAYEAKPKAGLTDIQKAQLQDIRNQLKVEYGLYAKQTEPEEQAATLANIEQLRSQMDDLVVNPTGPSIQAPGLAPWTVNPNSLPVTDVSTPEQANALDMFGKLGQRTPFMFSGAAAPPPVAPPTNRVRILNIRRR